MVELPHFTTRSITLSILMLIVLINMFCKQVKETTKKVNIDKQSKELATTISSLIMCCRF